MLDSQHSFELALWPHLRSAYHLARWLVGNGADAEDVVQEAFLKAFQAADRMRAAEARPWLLAIVRNTALNFRGRNRPKHEVPWNHDAPEPPDRRSGTEAQLIEEQKRRQVREAIERLPSDFREPLILREIEGLAYKEIAYVLRVPIGTVMSRLSRARALLLKELMPEGGTK